MVTTALEAAEALAKEGIDVEVVDLRTLRPLDEDADLESVQQDRPLRGRREGWPFAGVGAEIAYRVQRALLRRARRAGRARAPQRRRADAVRDEPRGEVQPDVPRMVAAVKRALYLQE